MNIEEYKEFLGRIDWAYEYSDDYSVYRKGQEAMGKARRLANTSEDHKQAFYKAYQQTVAYK